MSKRVINVARAAARSVSSIARRDEIVSSATLAKQAVRLSDMEFSLAFGENVKNVGRFFATASSSEVTPISLGASNPIFPPPPEFVAEALAASARDSEMRYYRSRSINGIPGLSEALKEHYRREGFNVDGCGTLFTNSIHTGLRLLLDNFLKKGDTVGLPIPTFGLFFEAIFRRGIGVNQVKLTEETDWKLTPEILRERLATSPEMKLFIFINPNNPIGKIYSKEETEALAKVFIEHNAQRAARGEEPLVVFNDESSKTIRLCDKPFSSIGAVKGMEDFTLTISSFSKDLAPGLALSYAIGPRSLIKTITDTSHDPLIGDSGPSFPLQYLAKRTFTEDRVRWEEHCAESNKFYVRNLAMVDELVRDLSLTMVRDLDLGPRKYAEILTPPQAGLQCVVRTAGMRGLTLDGRSVIDSSLILAYLLQSNVGVTLQPGENMGFRGDEMMFRVTISKDPDRIREAFDRMKTVLSRLRPALKDSERKPGDSVAPSTAKELAETEEKERG